MTAMLEVDDLTFAYVPSRPLFEGWSEGFNRGQLTAITGRSGQGKSTLLYILGLMLRPTSGTILIDGTPLGNAGDRMRASLRANLYGFVFQDAALDSTRTVLDNVMEGALYRGDTSQQTRAKALSLLEEVGVEVDPRAKPGQVSGGQAQRIALCRALLGDPQLILADEPTGNLDDASANIVLDAFEARALRGASVVVVTHDLEIARRCHRQIALG